MHSQDSEALFALHDGNCERQAKQIDLNISFIVPGILDGILFIVQAELEEVD